ncbi:cobalt-precorrin-6A reductase [Rhodobacteraceae bacterium]|nr:cobalt-precorrin-6A reductase [Paracoccaceae bacterium]
MQRILLLGGTTEAAIMARCLAQCGHDAVFSYAGRTRAPHAQPLPVRVGGFGGVAGLRTYLRAHAISHVIDATHPFAARMSHNAAEACAADGVALCRVERCAWTPTPDDRWIDVPDVAGATQALPRNAARVFLATGRQNLHAFAACPQHHYLLRLVDPPQAPLPLPDHSVIVARGPFDTNEDLALLRTHGITLIVAKNAGGDGARAKIEAARILGLPVIMIARPALPAGTVFTRTPDVLRWLDHGPALRGV